jgi:hypothetical protein
MRMRLFLLGQCGYQGVEGTVSDRADDTPLQSKLTLSLKRGLSTLLSWRFTTLSTTRTIYCIIITLPVWPENATTVPLVPLLGTYSGGSGC